MRRTVMRCSFWHDSSSAPPISIHSSPVAMASPPSCRSDRGLLASLHRAVLFRERCPFNASSTLPLYGAVRGVAVMLLDGLLNLLRRHVPPPGPPAPAGMHAIASDAALPDDD